MRLLCNICFMMLIVTLAGCASYSERTAGPRALMHSGRIGMASHMVNSPLYGAGTEELNALGSLELGDRGLINMNAGRPQEALFYLNLAIKKLEEEETTGYISKFFRHTTAFLTGDEELQPYKMPGYEKVVLYSHKAMCYLLLGDVEKAYNVTRKTISLQQEEWKKVQNIKYQYNTAMMSNTATGQLARSLMAMVDTIPPTVVSHINPVPDFIDGLVMDVMANTEERESALRYNAQIAYRKAYSASGAATALRAFHDVLDERKSRAAYILISEGQAPYYASRGLAHRVAGGSCRLNVAVPVLPPRPNVTSISVSTPKNQPVQLLRLCSMQDLFLTHYHEVYKSRQALSWAAHLLRSNVVSIAGSFAGVQQEALRLVSATQQADTRCLSFLPHGYYAMRLPLPEGATQLRLRAEAWSGGKSVSLTIPAEGPVVIYGFVNNNNFSASVAQFN